MSDNISDNRGGGGRPTLGGHLYRSQRERAEMRDRGAGKLELKQVDTGTMTLLRNDLIDKIGKLTKKMERSKATANIYKNGYKEALADVLLIITGHGDEIL